MSGVFDEPHPAWVRIVHYTQHAGIYQDEKGVRTGGVIRSGPLPFINTQDMGMPKAGQDLAFDYYETPVRPDVETEVSMMWEGPRTLSCFITITFTPKAGRYYQFMLNKGSGSFCTSDASVIERDKNGTTWHLTPNTDATCKSNGSTAEKRFSNARFEDPDYHQILICIPAQRCNASCAVFYLSFRKSGIVLSDDDTGRPRSAVMLYCVNGKRGADVYD